ncbi:MAG: DUF2970 domain-containing protein [Gammaproteobacteria bacterium]|nr:DUF2970 domain-containing protein [Gammaproteobacteria bacterium]MBT8134740.1 DUF2970 domain-containing protein [Gammaproteobacteria bacterium]NNJ49668.1 DUF2970 domain-containing protein [Gammaproteobacteria bacterium]
MNTEKQDTPKKITPLSFISSIIAAAFGVQSKKNRERDFEHGKFHHFIIGGIVFAVVFILIVIGVVKLVMHNAT